MDILCSLHLILMDEKGKITLVLYFFFIFLYDELMTFVDLSKVKEGHFQRGSISGLQLHGMNKKY